MPLDLRRRRKDYEDAQPLNTLLNVFGAVDSKTFLFKTGELSQNIMYRGRDAECLGREVIDESTAKFVAASRALGPSCRLTSVFMKRLQPRLPCGRYSNPVANEAVAARHAFLRARGSSLYTFKSFFGVTFKPSWASPQLADRLKHLALHPADAMRKLFSLQGRTRVLDAEIDSSLRTLDYRVQSFIEQTSDHLDARVLSVEEGWRELYRPLLNLDPEKASAVPLGEGIHLDFLLGDSVLEAYPDHLRLDNNYYIKPLTLKKLPGHTYANMLASLVRVDAELIIVTDWSVLESAEAAAMLRSTQRHLHNTKTSLFSHVWSEQNSDRQTLFDQSHEALIHDAGNCLEAIEMNGLEVGPFGLTVLPIGKSLEEAQRATAEVMKVVGIHDGALNEERYNGLNAFCAAMPGGSPYNLRMLIATNENHADMLTLFHPAEGERTSAFLRSEYLAELETDEKSLYFLNLHAKDDDVGHTLAIGPTGKGKSFLVNFLITHALKYDPYVVIFTMGPDYRWLTEACDGSYVSFLPDERNFLLNPYTLDPTPENLEFLTSFGRVLAEKDAPPLNEGDVRELFEGTRSLYVLDPSQRRVHTLSTTVSRSLGKRLKRWTEGEQYGGFFDNPAAVDNVAFNSFQCVNFEGLRNSPALEPVVFYLIHRINDIIYSPALTTTLKLPVIDETWCLCPHPLIRAYIATATRSWRKRNAAMILSTQSVRDFADAEGLGPIFESCPTKLLLANPSLDAQLYGDLLRLTPTEQEKVRDLVPKRQFLLKREGFAKVLNLNVDARSYWLFTTNPFESELRQKAMERRGSLSAALDELAGGSR